MISVLFTRCRINSRLRWQCLTKYSIYCIENLNIRQLALCIADNKPAQWRFEEYGMLCLAPEFKAQDIGHWIEIVRMNKFHRGFTVTIVPFRWCITTFQGP